MIIKESRNELVLLFFFHLSSIRLYQSPNCNLLQSGLWVRILPYTLKCMNAYLKWVHPGKGLTACLSAEERRTGGVSAKNNDSDEIPVTTGLINAASILAMLTKAPNKCVFV